MIDTFVLFFIGVTMQGGIIISQEGFEANRGFKRQRAERYRLEVVYVVA